MQLNGIVVNGVSLNDTSFVAETSLITIGKNITFKAAFQNTLARIPKIVVASQPTTPILTVGKIVRTPTSNTFYDRNGWEPIITIGSITVMANELTGTITINKAEESNATASFTIILYPDIYDLYSYQSKPVTISIRKNNAVTLLYTGIVDVPEINVIEEKLTLNCVADRRVLMAQMGALEPYIGYYADGVLGVNSNIADRITQRMTTIPYSLDFNGANQPTITSWTAKSTPDFSFGSSAVYRRNPQLTMDSAGQIINRVNMTIEYGYVRHHQAQCYTSWLHPYEGEVCPFLYDRPTVPSRQMILSAAQSAGWLPDFSSFDFAPLLKSGFYQCDGRWLAWSTIETGITNAQILDSNGNPVLDSEGNPTYRSVNSIISDNTLKYALSASWFSYKRYDQNIKESYTMSISSPESVSRYGVIEAAETYGYNAVDPYTDFLTVTAYNPSMGVSAQLNGDTDRNVFNSVYLCAINKAKTKILKSHRRNKINFQIPISPSMELYHTCALTGKWVRGKGKVQSIMHKMDISGSAPGDAYTDVTLLQYRGNQTVSETALTVPSAPAESAINDIFGVTLDTHLGEDPSQSGAAEWNGYIGNNWIYTAGGSIGGNYSRTQFQESFVVDTPSIPSNLTQNKTIVKSVNYDINIPNDDTEYETYF